MNETLKAMMNGLPDYNYIQRDVIRALERMAPKEPKFHKGRYGKKYDNYTCGNCGAGVNEAHWNYCPNCGQRITKFRLGERNTLKQDYKYKQLDIFDVFTFLEEGKHE